jgi:hypothetical protein
MRIRSAPLPPSSINAMQSFHDADAPSRQEEKEKGVTETCISEDHEALLDISGESTKKCQERQKEKPEDGNNHDSLTYSLKGFRLICQSKRRE